MTFQELIDECRPMHNDICIVADSDLARIVGVHHGENDFYYRLRGISRGEWLMSAVANVLSLRGLYPTYDIMDEVFALNHARPSDEFIITTATGSGI